MMHTEHNAPNELFGVPVEDVPHRFTVRRQDGIGPHPDDLPCKLCGKTKAQHETGKVVPDGVDIFGTRVDDSLSSNLEAMKEEAFVEIDLTVEEKKQLISEKFHCPENSVIRKVSAFDQKTGRKWGNTSSLSDRFYEDAFFEQIAAVIDSWIVSALRFNATNLLLVGDKKNESGGIDHNVVLSDTRING